MNIINIIFKNYFYKKKLNKFLIALNNTLDIKRKLIVNFKIYLKIFEFIKFVLI